MYIKLHGLSSKTHRVGYVSASSYNRARVADFYARTRINVNYVFITHLFGDAYITSSASLWLKIVDSTAYNGFKRNVNYCARMYICEKEEPGDIYSTAHTKIRKSPYRVLCKSSYIYIYTHILYTSSVMRTSSPKKVRKLYCPLGESWGV